MLQYFLYNLVKPYNKLHFFLGISNIYSSRFKISDYKHIRVGLNWIGEIFIGWPEISSWLGWWHEQLE